MRSEGSIERLIGMKVMGRESIINLEITKGDDKAEINPPYYSKDEKWVQEYIEQFREEPSFF